MRGRLLASLLAIVVLVLGFGSIVGPVAAQSGNWTVEYYGNPYLMGTKVLTQNVGQLNFNWGQGSPGTNVPQDGFSLRATTQVQLNAGTYRFWFLADDGVKLLVSYQEQFNTMGVGNVRPGELLSVDVVVPEGGLVHLEVDFHDLGGDAYLYFDYANLASNPSGPRFSTTPVNVTPSPVTQPVGTGVWTAEYFNNANLQGSPYAIITEASPSHNWGTTAPFYGMVADNFTARWTTTLYFDGSEYLIKVHADDGVRVFVDGVLYINRWGGYLGQTDTASVHPAVGNHTLVVEYLELGQLAAIDFNISKVISYTPPTQPNPGYPYSGATATINTGRLNVRDVPTVYGSNVLVKVDRGNTYPILGRNASSTWWLIDVNGIRGWVSAPFVIALNTGLVPIADATGTTAPAPTLTGWSLTTRAELNVRSGPSTSYSQIERIPQGGVVPIIARNSDATWWKIRYNNVVGWVSGAWVELPSGINFNNIPVE